MRYAVERISRNGLRIVRSGFRKKRADMEASALLPSSLRLDGQAIGMGVWSRIPRFRIPRTRVSLSFLRSAQRMRHCVFLYSGHERISLCFL